MDGQRANVRVSLKLGVRWEGLSPRCEAVTTDVSLGGCYIQTIAPVRVGERLCLDIAAAAEPSMQLAVEVVYQHPGLGFGVRFISLTDFQRMMLSYLIDCAQAAPAPLVLAIRPPFAAVDN